MTLPGVTAAALVNATIGGLLRAGFACALDVPLGDVTIIAAVSSRIQTPGVGGRVVTTLGEADFASANDAQLTVSCSDEDRVFNLTANSTLRQRRLQQHVHGSGSLGSGSTAMGTARSDVRWRAVAATPTIVATATSRPTSTMTTTMTQTASPTVASASNVTLRIVIVKCQEPSSSSAVCATAANSTAVLLATLIGALNARRGMLYAGLTSFGSAAGIDVAAISEVTHPFVEAPPPAPTPAPPLISSTTGYTIGLVLFFALLCLALTYIAVRGRRRDRVAPQPPPKPVADVPTMTVTTQVAVQSSATPSAGEEGRGGDGRSSGTGARGWLQSDGNGGGDDDGVKAELHDVEAQGKVDVTDVKSMKSITMATLAVAVAHSRQHHRSGAASVADRRARRAAQSSARKQGRYDDAELTADALGEQRRTSGDSGGDARHPNAATDDVLLT